MPRLNDRQYLKAHKQLRRFWIADNSVFGYLSSNEQWRLHAYFQPSKDLTNDELLVHRREITAQQPNLPHQAGRALAKLQAAAAQHALQRVRLAKRPLDKTPRTGKRNITVRGVVKPEVDTKRLARAFIALAEDLARKEKEASGDDHQAA
jgi:hypothetical protein